MYKTCRLCGSKFIAKSNRSIHCPDCLHLWPRPCICGCGKMAMSGKSLHAIGCVNARKSIFCSNCGKEFTSGSGNSYLCDSCKTKTCKYPGCNAPILLQSTHCYKHSPKMLIEHKCKKCGKLFKGHSRAQYCKECWKPHPCACGCGKMVKKPWNIYFACHSPEARAKCSHNYHAYGRKTTSIELLLYNALDKRSFKLSGQGQVDYGQPISSDIICKSAKLIVQVDGCFWHKCDCQGDRFTKEQRRDCRIHDKRMNKIVESEGWTVLRFWEHELYNDLDKVVKIISNKRIALLQI